MASAPKDQTGLDEPLPPSTSSILLLPTFPLEQQQEQEHTPLLEYISRMLMEEEEEEEEDRVLLQYHDDHPVLIQAQQSLAQVISSSSTSDNNASTTKPSFSKALLADESNSNLLFSSDGTILSRSATSVVCNTDIENATARAAAAEHDWRHAATMSFLMGMAEASKFLPRHSNLVFKTINTHDTGAEVSRASKLMAMAETEEAFLLQTTIDRMMLNDCKLSRGEMEDLRAAMKNEAVARRQERRQRKRLLQVDLHALLLRCAETVMDDGHRGARELLEKIKRHASPTGDATQRLAHCFAEALETRLAGMGAHRSSFTIHQPVRFLKAYPLYIATCCFNKVAFMFCNRSIYQAAAGRSRLHIVDYGVCHGFQWPVLLRWLAAREGGPPQVTITGIVLTKHWYRSSDHIEETGHRLSNCARELGVPFKFQAIMAAKWDAVHLEDLNVDPDAALAVNSLFSLEMMDDDSVVVDRASPRDVVLGNIRRMRPAVFTIGIVNGLCGSSFLTRFRETLVHYSAMFDMLDATMPRGSEQRLVLESDMLGSFALNIIACEGQDRTDRFESYKQWHMRMQRAELRQLPLDRDIIGAVTDMVKQQYHKDFVIHEDRRWLLQGWKGRILFAHSTWVADDAYSP